MKKVFTLCCTCMLMTVFLAACRDAHRPEEDVTKLRPAEEIQEVSDSIVLELKTDDLGETSKEIEVSLKNESDRSYTYDEELKVDRQINGTWYSWGTSGCYLESRYMGLEPGASATETFPLYEEALGEGDYITDEKGETLDHEEGSNNTNHEVHICFVPGTYRLRMQVWDGAGPEKQEAVCVFELGSEEKTEEGET